MEKPKPMHKYEFSTAIIENEKISHVYNCLDCGKQLKIKTEYKQKLSGS